MVLAVLLLAVVALTACAKSEFGPIETGEKRMVINAENADKDSAFTLSTLEVAEGEEVVITGALEKGMIRVEVFPAEAGEDAADATFSEDSVVLTADIKANEQAAAEFSPGSYLLRVTCLEKASGLVYVEAKPVD